MGKKLIPMAICYDFDGTLSPGNMQEYDFMKALGIKKSKNFWDEAEKIAKKQMADNIAAYMYLMIKESEAKNLPFKRETFKKYGKNIELYKGVEEWFKRTTDYAKQKGIVLKHYIISSGIKEIIEGTKIAKNFSKIYASSFMYSPNGEAIWPAVVLNYTSKTQYLFRINKGCEDITDDTKINEYVKPEERAIPFGQMIYIGDGSTDIPCMTIVKRAGGHSIAVYKSGKNGKSKAEHLIEADRVNAVLPADYSKGKQIDNYVKAVIDKVAADEALKVQCEVQKREKIQISKKKQIKSDFLQILRENFGEIELEYKFSWLALPEIDKLDVDTRKIYDVLSEMRGFHNFYCIGRRLRCDYVLMREKIIIEFDEKQHFTEQRARSLKFYPRIPLFFNKNVWLDHCNDIKAYDNDPPYRDEQRAFFDSLRDILSFKNGFKLIRFYERDLETSEGRKKAILRIKELKNENS